jgi:hypothetical protein
LYQQAKRIVGAENQNIVLDKKDPSITSAFATADLDLDTAWFKIWFI